MATVLCPQCQVRLKFDGLAQGKVRCPKCGLRFEINPAAQETAEPEPSEPDATPWMSAGLGIAIVILSVLITGGLLGAFMMLRLATEPEPPVAVAEMPSAAVDPLPPPEKTEPKTKVAPVPTPAETEKKRQDFTRLMVKASRAADTKSYDVAIAAYGDALKLFPEDEDAARGLKDAQASLAAQDKSNQDSDKVKQEVAQLVKQGQDSLEKKQYAAATEFFKLALQRAPTDTDASRGLVAAQQALALDLDQQKKKADFDRFLNAGRAALKAGRYGDAVREFVAAQGVLPGNPQAIALQRQAEQELLLLKNEDEAKKEFARLLDQGGNALRNQRFAEAEKTYRLALKLFPKDAAAEQGLSDTLRAGKQAQEEFRGLMTRGTVAMNDMRYKDAIASFREATKLFPADESASKALRDAELAQDRVATYRQAMKRAAAAMVLKRFGDAVAAYNEALAAIPNDTLAVQGLQDATRYFEEDVLARKECDRKLQQATQALKQQKYTEATRLLAEAVKLQPNHPQILLIQKQGRYSEAMGKGQTAMTGQNYREAVRQFQIALNELPGDFAAQSALTRARALAK